MQTEDVAIIRILDSRADAWPLLRWLERDESVRRWSKDVVPGPSNPEDMGDGLQLIEVVLSNAISLGNLVVSIMSWREGRDKPAPLEITLGLTRITIDSAESSSDAGSQKPRDQEDE